MNEYEGEAYFLREGRVTPVPALTELEELELPPLGKLEAFVTSGGLSTMPWTFARKLRVLENKTLRYPGHGQLLHGLRALGLFGREPIPVGSAALVLSLAVQGGIPPGATPVERALSGEPVPRRPGAGLGGRTVHRPANLVLR